MKYNKLPVNMNTILKIKLVKKYKKLNKIMYSSPNNIKFKYCGYSCSLAEDGTVWFPRKKCFMGFFNENQEIEFCLDGKKYHEKNKLNEDGFQEIKLSKGTRKNTDYQCTELVLALLCLGVEIPDLLSISSLAYENFETNKLRCSKDILDKYIKDLEYSMIKNTIDYSFITNFSMDTTNHSYVYLTGKTYKDYPEIVNLNKEYEQYKPNADVYVVTKDNTIFGVSCKQNKNSPLSNKIAEDHGTNKERDELTSSREKLLIDNGITLEKLMLGKTDKNLKKEMEKNISKILCNRSCHGEPLQEYWAGLTNHVIKYKDNFIDGVLHSVSQSKFLPYDVYEYDGVSLISTKEREFEKELCDIRISEIFCYGKQRVRSAAKIWFDFTYKGEVIYNLEVRFKNKWFQKGGCPQLFILKETPEDIKKYIITREKHKSLINNSS